jgi:hypothetical protein
VGWEAALAAGGSVRGPQSPVKQRWCNHGAVGLIKAWKVRSLQCYYDAQWAPLQKGNFEHTAAGFPARRDA